MRLLDLEGCFVGFWVGVFGVITVVVVVVVVVIVVIVIVVVVIFIGIVLGIGSNNTQRHNTPIRPTITPNSRNIRTLIIPFNPRLQPLAFLGGHVRVRDVQKQACLVVLPREVRMGG